MTHPLHVVVMGVSGSGKSTVAGALASNVGAPFVDGDDLHPAENKARMSAGLPLTDDDRWPWLALVGEALAAEDRVVVVCSALKRSYRDVLRQHCPDVRFVHLVGSREVLAERINARQGHFMPASQLDDQLATLEELQADENGFTVDVDQSVADIVVAAVVGLNSGQRA